MIPLEQIYTLTVYYLGMVAWSCLAIIFLRRYRRSRRILGERRVTKTLRIILIVVCAEVLATTYYGLSWSNQWVWRVSWLDVMRSPIFWGIPRTTLLIGAVLMLCLILREKVMSPLYYALKPIGLSLKIFHGLRNGLEKMYQQKATSLILYRAGKEAGILFTKDVIKKIDVKERELFHQIVEYNQHAGWADEIKIEDFKIGDRVVISTTGSFESIGRETPYPICDFQRGFWAGICQALTPVMICEAEETSCEARGDPRCRFLVKFFEKAKVDEDA